MAKHDNPLIAAQAEREAYERRLAELVRARLLESDIEPPWAAVALAYHHGLSFGPLIGVLPADELAQQIDAFEQPIDRFNPAEWSLYDDEVSLEDERLDELSSRLEALALESPNDTPRFGQAIHVRVSKALREVLVAEARLSEDGLVFATEYSQADWQANVTAANPEHALAAHGIAPLS